MSDTVPTSHESRGQHRGNHDYSWFFLRTMRYSLRRALSLDSVDGCTHNPTICSSAIASSNLFTSMVDPCRTRLPGRRSKATGRLTATATRVQRVTATHFPDISAIRAIRNLPAVF